MKNFIGIGIFLYFTCSVSLLHGAIIWNDPSVNVNHHSAVNVTYHTPASADMTPYNSNPSHNSSGYEYGDAPAP